MKRKFNIGDKVRLNPNMDYSRLSGISHNFNFSEETTISEFYNWNGERTNNKGELFRDLYCYALSNYLNMPESYLIRIK